MDKYSVLKQYFGHDSFRDGQEEIIDGILSGNDCLGVMPTGAGKSMCYQIPAILMGGTAIVISPLISLMKDQVEALQQAGVPAAYINSSLSSHDYFRTLNAVSSGKCRLLYVAPERLAADAFIGLCTQIEIPLIAVDEAHCVSQWGQDFRPSYLKIPEFIRMLKKRPVVAAFTATATKAVKEDITNLLELRNPRIAATGFDRKNLYFDVRYTPSSQKTGEAISILSGAKGRSSIVYCSTRNNVEAVCKSLCASGISAAAYHAGLEDEVRKKAQEDFVYDRVDVIVATNAFGMGIDKSNVSLVLHYNMPKDVESYYQEAGRAGRDGSPARCIMLFDKSDEMIAKRLIEYGHQDSELPTAEVEELKRRDTIRLEKMVGYCKSKGCLRKYILGYFGDSAEDVCVSCSVCNSRYNVTDITVAAQKILSCIFRLKQRGTAKPAEVIAHILRGEKTEEITEGGFSSLSTYGIMEDSTESILSVTDYLITSDYIKKDEDGLCHLTEAAEEFIKNRRTLLMKQKKESTAGSTAAAMPRSSETENPELLAMLSAVRKKIGATLGVPAFVVFSDKTLREMSEKQPVTMEEFLGISGVGSLKAERYGEKFIGAVKTYQREKSGSADSTADSGLLDELRTVRKNIAAELNLPDIMIFTDEALLEMSEKKPRTTEQFLKISGVGQLKAQRYGEKFLSAINGHCKDSAEKAEIKPAPQPAKPDNAKQTDGLLMEKLRELRHSMAQSMYLPDTMIFTDEVLTEMCEKKPLSFPQLLEINGISRLKAELHGDKFTAVIAEYGSIKPSAAQPQKQSTTDNALLDKLKSLRSSIAKEAKLPAYCIFQNRALEAMAAAKPKTIGELCCLDGIGERTAQKYGSQFLKAIEEHLGSQSDE